MQQVKDPVWSLQWLVSPLRHRFNPWTWNDHMASVWPEKKKKDHIVAVYKIDSRRTEGGGRHIS